MSVKVFIDGKEGTTGLRIYDRLASRQDITLLTLPESERKDPEARRSRLHEADVAILCLPDAAARESVALLEGSHARVLDTSTAHRTEPGWAYGFPELSFEQRNAIASGEKTAVPGCHASGFIALISPLVRAGILPHDAMLSCFSLTGYSGGGRKMISQYQAVPAEAGLDSPRQYGLQQAHKHLKEMQLIPGLTCAPIFAPIVADYYCGMEVTVPLFPAQTRCSHPMEEIRACLADHYFGSPVVKVLSSAQVDAMNGFLPADALAGRDDMELMVLGSDDRVQLCARFDNLGKGSSGAALQCLNLMLGTEETAGLTLA